MFIQAMFSFLKQTGHLKFQVGCTCDELLHRNANYIVIYPDHKCTLCHHPNTLLTLRILLKTIKQQSLWHLVAHITEHQYSERTFSSTFWKMGLFHFKDQCIKKLNKQVTRTLEIGSLVKNVKLYEISYFPELSRYLPQGTLADKQIQNYKPHN